MLQSVIVTTMDEFVADSDSCLTVEKWFHPIEEYSVGGILSDPRIPIGNFIIHSKDNDPSTFLITIKLAGNLIQLVIIADNQKCKFFLGKTHKSYFNVLAEILANILKNKIHMKLPQDIPIQLNNYVKCTIPANLWFIPKATIPEGLQILKDCPITEVFSVWLTPDDTYILGIKRYSGCFHYQLNRTDKGLTIENSNFFPDPVQLINYYQQNSLPKSENGFFRSLPQAYVCSSFYASLISSRIEMLSSPISSLDQAKDYLFGEFKNLELISKQFGHKYVDGHNPEYASKNRYKNILPYEHSRVKLQNSKSDYINANFVNSDHQESPTCYILCQAPIEATVNDHWNMIIENNVTVVVILTGLVEKGTKKCVKYWPSLGKSLTLANKKVIKLEYEKENGEIIHRICNVSFNDERPEIKVNLLHYTGWPDFGVPCSPWNLIQLLIKCNNLRNAQKKTTLVVHCSAGVGRTGAFVAIDMILNRLKEKGLSTIIDIKRTVLKIRSQRGATVTTVEQYRFIYETIKAYIEAKLGPESFQL